MSATLLKNATYINEGCTCRRDILLNNGLIEKIDNCIPADDGYEIIDCSDMLVLPGVIDDQVHFREPGAVHKATIATESVAAVLGGTTSFMDMPNNNPPAVTIEDLQAKKDIAARNSYANYSFYLGATETNMDEICRINPQEICGVKIFMGSSTGNLLVDRDEALYNIFKNSRVLIATHCEDNALINRNMEEFKAKYGEENLKPYMHPLIRNHKACYRSSKKAVDLALETGANLHVLHLSTKDEIELFRPFAGQPVRDRKITAEVCAHHMFFNDKDYERLGNRLKCNPAVKTEEDRQALVNAVEQGIISIIATDHAPHTIEEKNQPFCKAPSGLPLIQFSLLAVLDLVHRNELSIEAAVTALSHNPAERFNIDRRGYIREGYFADIVIVKKNDYTVKPVDIASKCKWSPFLGHTFSHKVMHTFVNGNHVVTNGIFTPNNIFGRDLRFNR